MEDALTAALMGSSALTALVGERIHWKKLPDRAALPAVILSRSGVGRFQTMGGLSPTTTSRVQFDCWAGTDEQAGAVRDAVLEVLRPFMVRADNAAPGLQVALNADPPDYWSPGEGPDADRSTDLYRQSLDAQVWHFTA